MNKLLASIYNTMSVIYVCAWAVAFISVTIIVFIKETFTKLKTKYERFRRR